MKVFFKEDNEYKFIKLALSSKLHVKHIPLTYRRNAAHVRHLRHLTPNVHARLTATTFAAFCPFVKTQDVHRFSVHSQRGLAHYSGYIIE